MISIIFTMATCFQSGCDEMTCQSIAIRDILLVDDSVIARCHVTSIDQKNQAIEFFISLETCPLLL